MVRLWLQYAMISLIALQIRDVFCQEQVTVLRGSGNNESAPFILKASQLTTDWAGKSTDIIYRVVSTATAQTDFVSPPSTPTATVVDFAVGAGPLPSASFTSLGGAGSVIQIPFGLMTVSFYFNIPNAPSNLNMSACTIAKILTGSYTSWNIPSVTGVNPGLTLLDPSNAKIVSFYSSSPTDIATQMVNTFLLSSNGCPASWTSNGFTGTAVTNMSYSVMSTPYSIGYLLTYQGASYKLKEVALQNPSGAYVSSSTLNITNTQAAVQAVLPSSYTADFSGVSFMGLSGATIYPIAFGTYIYMKANQASSSDKGALLQALVNVMLSSSVQNAYINSAGFYPVGTTMASAALSGLTSSMTIATGSYPAYALDLNQANVSANGADLQAISASRVAADSYAITNLQNQINALKTQLLATNPQVVHGSGSSAVSLVMWYHMDYIMAQSTQPLYLSYRAIGSGGGEGEIVGNPTGSSALVDFGVSDVPMTHQSWQALSTLNIQVIQIPLHVAPIGMFVNIPSSYLPGRKMNLSACTVSGIYSGSIKLWNDPAIVADNPGVTLNFPPEPIIPLYRDEASGTNAVFSEYFSAACTSWALGSGKVLPAPGATGTFAAAAVPTAASSTMSLYIKANSWTIGYIDVGNANALGLMEVYQKNAAGVWLISSQSDPGAAASELFQSGGWPANPINDFSGVSLVNQPGAATWPITSMPFMFIRVDLTQRGSSGPLVQALANYIMSPAAQANLPGLGFGQLPTAIVQYCVQRALPLLSSDPAYPQWYFENSNGVKFVGAVNNVISATKDTYIHTNLIALELAAGNTSTSSSSSSSSSSGSVNASSLNISLSSLSGVTSIQAQTAHNSNQISILTSVCIAALIFGIASLLLALFAVMKLAVIATHLHGGHHGVLPMSTAGMPRTMSVTGKASSAKGVKASGSGTMQESSASLL